MFFFFKQKTAYELRISDWSSDVCSSDLLGGLELAKRNVTTDPGVAVRYIDNATEGANRAAALTRRLLAFSRADALLPEALDAGALIAGMTELLDRTLGDAIQVEKRTGDTDWRTWAATHPHEQNVGEAN